MELIDREKLLKSISLLKNSTWYNDGWQSQDQEKHRCYLTRKEAVNRIINIILGEQVCAKSTKDNKLCEYWKSKNGYISGCGFRVAYNKYWHWCPICHQGIAIINKKTLDKSEENKEDYYYNGERK